LAILKNNKMAHYVFALPSTLLPDDVQYQIKWLSKNHHCIKWDTGFVPHWKFQQILKKVISDGDSVHVKGKEKAKFIEKCIKLSVAMRNLWCLEKISILPLVISATGIVPQTLFKNLKILDLDNTLVVEIQKGILLYSCHIVRKFLNIDTEHNTQQSQNVEARRR
jgi:hypothetical protein